MSEENRDKGWDFLHSDRAEGSFFEDDGSWGTQNPDGSGSYYGADGSWGYKNADGSASFYGADGSWGYKNADGSSSYYGENGAWGYKNADGSGAYYGSSSEDDQYYDANKANSNYADSYSSESADWVDLLASAAGVAITLGAIKYSQKREQERQEEAEREAEAERIRLEKAEERKTKNELKKKRRKALLFKGKRIEIPYDYEDLIGRSKSFVADTFTKGAFTNIKVVPIKDIYTGSKYTVGQVEQIEIDGSTSFSAGDLISYDAEIVITYHDKREIVIPFSERFCRKLGYITVGDKLQELGFTEVYERPISDLVTGWIKKDGAVEKVTIGDGSPFKKNSAFPYDTKIVIEYHTFKKK